MVYREKNNKKVILDLNAKKKILAFLTVPLYRMRCDILIVGAEICANLSLENGEDSLAALDNFS